MAQNLRLLKRRIKTAQNIAQISKAMEMISASKIKKAQTAVVSNKPYAERITNLTQSILKHTNMQKFNHPFINKKDSNKSLIIVISPDKGLCGSLNTNLFKKILEMDNKNLKYMVLGKKAEQFCHRLEGEVIGSVHVGTTLPDYKLVYRLIELINTEYVNGEIGEVKILYSEFNSVFSQVATVKKILPFEPVENGVEDEPLPYIFEPKAEIILKELLPYLLEVTLYTALLESFTSEQAARMMAMQNAKNNALDIADYLTLSYNKSRQERITSELLVLSNNA
ncbi:MAG TPA: ATP synthase F1 subunit gamma [Patescibacteria group bacterium]|nr:ATP synthase F1 subunit gamma [Patescibacteria group bacterium]